MKQCYIVRDPDTGSLAAAIADLVPWPTKDSRHYLITRINVMEQYRRQGFGTMILMKIFKDADKDQVILFLEPQAYDKKNQSSLVKWYEKHGFIWDGWYMSRKPVPNG